MCVSIAVELSLLCRGTHTGRRAHQQDAPSPATTRGEEPRKRKRAVEASFMDDNGDSFLCLND